METKQSVGNYIGINKDRFFKIPAYQRGYKWGELKTDKSCDASILVKDILQAMKKNKAEYFIQGVTVYENNLDVVLIDGQQRTTTLFLLLSLLLTKEEILQYLFIDGVFKLKYDIREGTQVFLENHCLNKENIIVSQDEFLINQAVIKMRDALTEAKADRDKLKKYVLENVKLFYIKIPEKHATQVFSMLNGSKAFMTTDELIKSAFLSEATKASQKPLSSKSLSETMENLTSQIGEEWQTTTMRSRYARQWDKWMYWWNKKEVKAFFDCGNNPMGRLLEFFYQYDINTDAEEGYSNKPENVATMFKKFQNLFIHTPKAAKENFDKLRKLQKTFEDLYNNTFTHNYLGLALTLNSKRDSLQIIDYFIQNFKDEFKIKRFVLLGIIGTSVDKTDVDINEEFDDVIALLSSSDVYNNVNAKEYAFKMLFLLNVLASVDRNVKFEFFYLVKNTLEPFYKFRSLEHIWPKSKVAFSKEGSIPLFKIDENGDETMATNQDTIIQRSSFKNGETEHCIGNLLLLHKHDNSAFNAKLPELKKLVYFDLDNDIDKDKRIYSRNLLHTMSAFAIANWSQENTIENIATLKDKTISKLKKIYNDVVER